MHIFNRTFRLLLPDYFSFEINLAQSAKVKKIFLPSNSKGERSKPADSLRNSLLIQSSDKAIQTPEFKLNPIHQVDAWPDACFPSS